MDSGLATLPRTPARSFRESVRRSLRRLRRNQKKRGGGGGGDVKRRKGDQASYQVTVTPTKPDAEEDEVYEVIKAQDMEYPDTEEDTDRVVIVHESRKPSFKSDNQSLATSLDKISASNIVVEYSETKKERNSWTENGSGKDSVSTSSQDMEMTEKNISLINDQHSQLIPRGPLGNLLKQKLSQSSVETVIIHKEIEEDDIPEQNIDFKVEHIPVEDKEVDKEEAEEVDEAADVESIVSRALMDDMIGSVLERHLTPALAIHPRQGTNSLELPLKPGDIVFLHRRLNRDWYLGERKGVRGLIPAAYIQ